MSSTIPVLKWIEHLSKMLKRRIITHMDNTYTVLFLVASDNRVGTFSLSEYLQYHFVYKQ